MIKHFYFIDPDGNFYSEDGTTRYRREIGKTGAVTARYMRETMDVRFIESKMGDVLSLIEVGQAHVKDYRKQERREQYMRDLQYGKETIILSLDNVREENGEEFSYHEIIASDYDLEEEVLKSEKHLMLKKCLSALNKEERELIHQLYLRDEVLTEAQYAALIGTSQQVINYRKTKILEKMKKFLKSFC